MTKQNATGFLRRAALGVLVLCATTAIAAAQQLPPVPEAIKKQGLVRVGVKCDYPPDGFLDSAGKPQGIEVNLGKQMAAHALGSAEKSEITCVTAANRIPQLQGGKIDVIIATLGISEERAKVIDFSERYAWGASDVLLPANSQIKNLKELAGKTVIVLKGAWQIGWYEQNIPQANLLRLDTVSDALQALLQGRGDAYAHDDAVLVPIAKKNPRVKVLGDLYQYGFRGAGVRKGESEWLAFVNASIAKSKRDGLIDQWVKQYVEADLQDFVLKTWDLSKVPN